MSESKESKTHVLSSHICRDLIRFEVGLLEVIDQIENVFSHLTAMAGEN